MDNPWADPWGQASNNNLPEDTPPIPTWDERPIIPVATEQELAPEPPSWEPKASVSWSASVQPSWNGEEHPAWSLPPSSLNGVSNVLSTLTVDDNSTSDITKGDQHDAFDASTPSTPVVPVDDIPSSPLAVQIDIAPPFLNVEALPAPIPQQDLEMDGFGGFESGLDSATEEPEAWSISPNPFSEKGGDVWENTWEASTTERMEDAGADAQPDEWEAARQRKAEQDKHVPPEFLQHIIAQAEQLGADLWKDESASEANNNTIRSRHFDPQSLNLNSCHEKIVPDQLTLPLPTPFSQTFASKRLADSLKLTRHAVVSRMGPMAMYMASKGSTSWEASVKAKADVSDVAPPGWKILPREDSPKPDDQSQKRPAINGGILSFFTRRSTNPPTPERPQRSASPAISITTSIKTENNSPRISADSPAIQDTPPQVKEMASTAVTRTESLYQSAGIPQPPKVSPTTPKGLDVFSDDHEEEEAASSTMSRFFGRFTRNSRSAISQKDSISLSADDLEFLSDVVPVAQEQVKEDAQLRALSSMIRSSPLPTTLPPPLAPPPRAPKPSPRLSSHSAPSVNMAAPKDDHDLFSMFETPALPDKPATNMNKQLQPLPSIPFSNSAHALNVSASVSATSLNTLAASTSFSDFFATSPILPPPIPPPKAPESFFVPIGSMQSTTTSPPRTTTSQSSSIPALFPPPPPSSRSRPPTSYITSGTSLPSSRSNTPASFVSPPSHPTINEDDEFSDFITSPLSKSVHYQNSIISAFPASTTPIVSGPTSNHSQFDDFNDFFTPTQSKAATARAAVSLPQSRSTSPPQITAPSSPRVSRAEHQRTLSLLETVATRGDKWLSPPSPLPVALPPPNAPGKASDLLGSGPSMEMQQTQAIAALSSPASLAPPPARKGGASGWTFPAPPAVNGSQPKVTPLAPSSFGLNPNATSPPRPAVKSISPAPAAAAASTKGGLSASDLAFFEGL